MQGKVSPLQLTKNCFRRWRFRSAFGLFSSQSPSSAWRDRRRRLNYRATFSHNNLKSPCNFVPKNLLYIEMINHFLKNGRLLHARQLFCRQVLAKILGNVFINRRENFVRCQRRKPPPLLTPPPPSAGSSRKRKLRNKPCFCKSLATRTGLNDSRTREKNFSSNLLNLKNGEIFPSTFLRSLLPRAL